MYLNPAIQTNLKGAFQNIERESKMLIQLVLSALFWNHLLQSERAGASLDMMGREGWPVAQTSRSVSPPPLSFVKQKGDDIVIMSQVTHQHPNSRQ